LQEAYSSLIIIYKATLVRIAYKCFLHDRRENRKYASSHTTVVRIAKVFWKLFFVIFIDNSSGRSAIYLNAPRNLLW